VELCEIDIPQKTQRKNITKDTMKKNTKNTKKKYHSTAAEETKKI
jgi:hypothetical protein